MVRFGGHRLHGVDAGVIVAVIFRDHANQFWIDRQRWVVLRNEDLVRIREPKERVGGVGEDAREVGVVRIADRLLELEPQVALPNGRLRILVVALIRRKAKPAPTIFGTCAGVVVTGS